MTGTSAAPAKPAPAKAAAKPAATYSASAPQSDQQLQAAATDIANTQVNGGLQSLAQIMARQSAQTGAAQQSAAGLYQGLGQNVQASNQQLGQIGSGLNSTLQGIGDQTQQSLGSTFQPSAELSRLDAQGLGGGGVQALAQALAQQKGFAGQDAQAFRSAGALQGANSQALGASNLGSYALHGQEALTGIGRAGASANQKVSDAEVKLAQSQPGLYSTALGQLTQAEANRELAAATLGVKQTTAATGQQNANTTAKAQAATAQHLSASDTLAAQKLAATTRYQQALLGIRQIDSQTAAGHLSEQQRHDLATERLALQKIRAAGAPGTTAKITTGDRSAASSLVSRVNYLKTGFTSGGLKDTSKFTQTALSGGDTPEVVNIARDLAVLGHVSPQNRAAALRIVGGQASLLPPAWGI